MNGYLHEDRQNENPNYKHYSGNTNKIFLNTTQIVNFRVNQMRCSVHHAPPHLAPINVRQLLTIEMDNISEFFKVNLLDFNIFKKCSITCNKGKYSKKWRRVFFTKDCIFLNISSRNLSPSSRYKSCFISIERKRSARYLQRKNAPNSIRLSSIQGGYKYLQNILQFFHFSFILDLILNFDKVHCIVYSSQKLD